MLHFAEYESPLGKLILVSDGAALKELRFGGEVGRLETDPVLTKTEQWLDGYFRGAALPLDVPLKPEGTAFQRQVWESLLTIPWGETRTYGSIARQLGDRMSAQAVGQAVGRNPISILVPCHRVVGTKGRLIGYAWGVEKKQWLLCHEGQNRE